MMRFAGGGVSLRFFGDARGGAEFGRWRRSFAADAASSPGE
jgi:hypothetical protein